MIASRASCSAAQNAVSLAACPPADAQETTCFDSSTKMVGLARKPTDRGRRPSLRSRHPAARSRTQARLLRSMEPTYRPGLPRSRDLGM